MPNADDFRDELYCTMLEAMKSGDPFAEINAGELHRRVGDYPGRNHRMPICCQVRRSYPECMRGPAAVREADFRPGRCGILLRGCRGGLRRIRCLVRDLGAQDGAAGRATVQSRVEAVAEDGCRVGV